MQLMLELVHVLQSKVRFLGLSRERLLGARVEGGLEGGEVEGCYLVPVVKDGCCLDFPQDKV